METGKESRKESDLMFKGILQSRKAYTRADKIRQMSDSELRDFLYSARQDFCWNCCAYYDDCCTPKEGTGFPDCQEGIKAYLQEVLPDEK